MTKMSVPIDTVVEGLKIDKNILKQRYNDLSGGEKTLIQLAKALIIKPDLILLDEPTNHLDIGRIEWLEEYIKSFKGASVIVSHDRYFINKFADRVIVFKDGYIGNYDNYKKMLLEKSKYN